ncbi:MAG: hypothetical protein ABJB16_16825, partial [Saprospiraceae bacterium]
YRLNGQEIRQYLNWMPSKIQRIQNINFSYDINEPVRYRMIFLKSGDEKKVSGYTIIGKTDDYIFISVEKE